MDKADSGGISKQTGWKCTENLKIVLDYRERKILEILGRICDKIELKNLPVGDILIELEDHSVLIERKSVPDFIDSVRSNRMWEQLLKLVKIERIFDHEIRRKSILIHGSVRDLLLYDFDEKLWASLSGALMEIVYVYGIPVFFIEDDAALSTFIRILIQRELRGSNDSQPKERWFRRRLTEMPSKDIRLYVLSSLPDVGNIIAKNLLDHFGSIERIATASVNDLMEVDGIGRKKARKIYEIFHS